MFNEDKKFHEGLRKFSEDDSKYEDINTDKNKCWKKVLDDLDKVAEDNGKGYFLATTSKRGSKDNTSASPMIIKGLDDAEFGATVSLMLTEYFKDSMEDDEERNQFMNAIIQTVNTASVFQNKLRKDKNVSDKELDDMVFENKEIALQQSIKQVVHHLSKNNKHDMGYFFMTFPNVEPEDITDNSPAELCVATDLGDTNFISMLVLAILQECKIRHLEIEDTMEKLYQAVLTHSPDDLGKLKERRTND